MRAVFVVLVLAALVAVAAAQGQAPNPSADFTANVTYSQSGMKYHAFMAYNPNAGRNYFYVQEFRSHTFEYQVPGRAITYKYVITTSGCTCTRSQSALITDFFAPLRSAPTADGSCQGGKQWTGPYLAIPEHTQASFCMNGDKPVEVTEGNRKYTFVDFNPQKSATFNFPDEIMKQNAAICEGQCI